MKLFSRELSCAVIFFLFASPAFAATYYVGPTNCSNTGNGSQNQPRCSISSGLSLLKAGTSDSARSDTLRIMAGTYSEAVTISKAYVTVMGNGDGEVIIDGGHTTGDERTYNPLVTISGTGAILRDVTIANSKGEGGEIDGSYGQFINIHVHDNQENGIIMKGDYSVCDGCRAWLNAMSNIGGGQSSGWGTGISACRSPKHATIRNSMAWNNWGEGISSFNASYTALEDNISYDNFSVNMYIQNVTHGLVQRNLVYRTANNYLSTYSNPGFQSGIVEDNEPNDGANSSDNVIINNVAMGNNGNFVHWSTDPPLTNAVVANNTFINASTANPSFSNVNISGSVNSIFKNNIIVQTTSGTIATISGGVTLANNIWSKTPSTKGATDVVGDPKLAQTGTFAAGQLTGDWFKLTSASTLAIDNGTSVPSIDGSIANLVSDDYFKTARGAAPDVGAYEYQAGNSVHNSWPVEQNYNKNRALLEFLTDRKLAAAYNLLGAKAGICTGVYIMTGRNCPGKLPWKIVSVK